MSKISRFTRKAVTLGKNAVGRRLRCSFAPLSPDLLGEAVPGSTRSAIYGQRALSETVFSSIKRTLGHAVRARAWYREFREIVLMCAVYNIKRAVTQ